MEQGKRIQNVVDFVNNLYFSAKKRTPENSHIDVRLIPSTEFILSYREKRELVDLLSQVNTSVPPSKELVQHLLYSLYIINHYTFFDNELLRIFNYVCQHVTDKLEITKCMFIKKYTCADTIPQPHYNHIKSIVTEKGMVLGDISHFNCYVLLFTSMYII